MSLPEPEDRLIRKPELIASDMDGDLVMMSIERGEYYGISGVGVRIWALLAEPVTVAEIVAKLTREYAIDSDRCLQDCRQFLAGLIERGLVDRC